MVKRPWSAGILAAATLLGGAWLAQLDFARKVSTDVLDLLPADEQAAEYKVVRAAASEAEARTMLFLIEGPSAVPAAAEFASYLEISGEFVRAVSLDDPAVNEDLGTALFERRFFLLFPQWLAERQAERAAAGADATALDPWLARRAAERLSRFLREPTALPFQDLIPADPLLLLPDAVARLQGVSAVVQPPAGTAAVGRVWAQARASPLQEEGQGPVFAAIATAFEATGVAYPGIRLTDTGVNRFAAASRARIEAELSWLNSLSLAAVLAVAVVFVRRLHRALHLLPPVLLAILGAWVGTTLVFERVHILVFVLGALLTGVAIDYGFYLFMPAPGGQPEDYGAKVRRLAKPLLSSCFTAVAGFALLAFSELPLIRQLGVFVGIGLVCALGAALLWFNLLDNTVLELRNRPAQPVVVRPAGRAVRLALLAAWVVALAGLARVRWTDDVRMLEIPAPELRAADARIRAAFGQDPDRVAFLSSGPTIADARDALDRFHAQLAAAGLPAENVASAGAVLPTPAEFAEGMRYLAQPPEFIRALRPALEAEGFDAGAFFRFETDFVRAAAVAAVARPDLGQVVSGLQARLTGPASLLIHQQPGLSWFVTVVRSPPPGLVPVTSTASAGQLQSLNALFAKYRSTAVRLSLIGLAVVGAGVLACYGLRDGLRIFAIPAGTCLGLFGLLGWLGVPLNLFHLLGAFLGVCLAHNYSIFSAPAALRDAAPPISVRMSALTTAASFGVLTLSGIPAVRALGLTVAAMVLAALLVIELRLAGPRREET